MLPDNCDVNLTQVVGRNGPGTAPVTPEFYEATEHRMAHMLDVSSRLELALAVRRRLVAELVAAQAAGARDAQAAKMIARLQSKIQHLDVMIERFEKVVESASWWPLGGKLERLTTEMASS